MVKKSTSIGIKKSTQKNSGGVRTKELGKPSVITAVERASAKAVAKTTGKKYQNLVNKMRTSRRK